MAVDTRKMSTDNYVEGAAVHSCYILRRSQRTCKMYVQPWVLEETYEREDKIAETSAAVADVTVLLRLLMLFCFRTVFISFKSNRLQASSTLLYRVSSGKPVAFNSLLAEVM